jgi:hypothetical protein
LQYHIPVSKSSVVAYSYKCPSLAGNGLVGDRFMISQKPTSWEFRLFLTITLHWPTSRYLSERLLLSVAGSGFPGRSSDWLERLPATQEFPGSSPVAPAKLRKSCDCFWQENGIG